MSVDRMICRLCDGRVAGIEFVKGVGAKGVQQSSSLSAGYNL